MHTRDTRASRKLVAIVFFLFSAAPVVQWSREAALVPRKGAVVPKAKKGVGPCRAQNQTAKFWLLGILPSWLLACAKKLEEPSVVPRNVLFTTSINHVVLLEIIVPLVVNSSAWANTSSKLTAADTIPVNVCSFAVGDSEELDTAGTVSIFLVLVRLGPA